MLVYLTKIWRDMHRGKRPLSLDAGESGCRASVGLTGAIRD